MPEVNIKELPAFFDTYIGFGDIFDYQGSFDSWWSEFDEFFREMIGDQHAEWLRDLVRQHWETSPMALRLLDDAFHDHIRRMRENHGKV